MFFSRSIRLFILIFTIYISSEAKPIATITSPIIGSMYRGGDVISFSGIGTDAIDGELPASAFTWYINFRHAEHTHDGPPILRNAKSGTYSLSQTNEVSADVYYQLVMIVENSAEETDTAYVDIHPYKSVITITSNFQGVRYSLFGTSGTYATPFSRQAVQNMLWAMYVENEQIVNGDTLVFANWGGSDCSTNITYYVPEQDSSLQIIFEKKTDRIKNTTTTSAIIPTVHTITSSVSDNIVTVVSCILTVSGKTTSILGCGLVAYSDTASQCQFIVTNISSTHNFDKNSQLFYPNPLTDSFTIIPNGIVSYKILSVIGTEIKSDLNFYPGNQWQVDVSDLASGYYVLKIKNSQGTDYTSRFFKL